MKQVLLNPSSGEITVAEVPAPSLREQGVVVRTAVSLISAGTERAVTEIARKSLLAKARQRPDDVRAVISKMKADGISKTLDAVFTKLGTPMPLGYSSAGEIVSVGREVRDLLPGQRVACAGGGFASHAEIAYVPRTLVAPIPSGVDFESAAFGTVGAVGLQGVRVAAPTFGELFVVIGLGLIGQLTVQMLRASGCRVLGVDISPSRGQLAVNLGAEEYSNVEDARSRVQAWSGGAGADGVIITASTPSNSPVELAGEISRLKGRVVVIGAVGMAVPRDVYYRKELALTVSMSYGPGRYDDAYEQGGKDYPYAYVRWTEGRNLSAFLHALAHGAVRVEPLISHRFAIADASKAYAAIAAPNSGAMATLLTYPDAPCLKTRVQVQSRKSSVFTRHGALRLGVIGAGNYAQLTLFPHLSRMKGLDRVVVASSGGLSATRAADRFGFRSATSSVDDVLSDPDIDAVIIATRHDSHADLARRSLEANKHVFVEKPLAISTEQLDHFEANLASFQSLFTVGFNRRWSPAALAAREFVKGLGSPVAITCRVNSGYLHPSHWLQNPALGGGRIVGEACHFMDLLSFLTGALPHRVYAECLHGSSTESTDTVIISLKFLDGSVGSICYLSNGDKSLGKERLEVFGAGQVFVIDDFRQTFMYANGRVKRVSYRSQDKGHARILAEFFDSVRAGGEPPIPVASILSTSRCSLSAMASLQSGLPQVLT